MAELATIARPYAKALFSLAQEGNKLEPWLKELQGLAALLSCEKVAAALDDPQLSYQQKAETLLDLAETCKADQQLSNFVTVLSENDRLVVLPAILTQYEYFMQEATGKKQATIYSAFDMSAAQLSELLPDLEVRFGSKLDAHVEVKPELIGGVKVEVGDQVLDMSVQAQLKALYTAIIH